MERLSYSEFKRQLLVQLALSTEGSTDTLAGTTTVASRIKDFFQKSWVATAAKNLEDDGYVEAHFTIGGTGDSFKLTGQGLSRAEEIARENGFDLYEEMPPPGAALLVNRDGERILARDGSRVVVPVDSDGDDAGPIIQIDPLSQAFKELDAQMAIAIRDLHGRNELMETEGPEASQRIAELEAGKTLLKAEQADTGLLKRTLLPALTWFAKKVGDEATKQLLAKLIAAVLAFIGSAQ